MVRDNNIDRAPVYQQMVSAAISANYKVTNKRLPSFRKAL